MTAVSLATSSALAAVLVLGQVGTSSVSKWTPEACRSYREASIINEGTARKCVEATDQIRGDLVDCEARVVVLETKQLEPPPRSEYVKPAWGGWPWVTLALGVALGVAGTVIILEGPP